MDSGAGGAAFNMALDEALLEAMPRLREPVLRFYGWTKPAASFGYFQKIRDIERLTLLRPLVRRPTGGGLVPHDADWTYSVAIPTDNPWYSLAAVESYRRIHEWVAAAFAKLGVATTLAPARRLAAPGQCFVGYEKDDVLWQGTKIAGAAQRRTKAGLLIQGSVQPPRLTLARKDWEQAMLDAGGEHGICWQDATPDKLLENAARRLAAERFGHESFLRKR